MLFLFWGTWDHWFEIFCFNWHLVLYIPSKYCLRNIPQILILCFSFSLNSKYFLISLLVSSLTREVCYMWVLQIILYISNLICLWLDSISYMTWNLLNLLDLFYDPEYSSVLVNDPCALEKNAYSAVVVWSTLLMPSIPILLIVLLVFYILNFVLPIIEKG